MPARSIWSTRNTAKSPATPAILPWRRCPGGSISPSSPRPPRRWPGSSSNAARSGSRPPSSIVPALPKPAPRRRPRSRPGGPRPAVRRAPPRPPRPGRHPPHQGLNATPFQRGFRPATWPSSRNPGHYCFGHSGLGLRRKLRLSAVFSPGSGSDLNLADILDFLAADPPDRKHPPLPRRHPRQPPLHERPAPPPGKPVVVVRPGGPRLPPPSPSPTPPGDGGRRPDLRRRPAWAGALRVRSIGDLFSAARAPPPRRPQNNRLAVISNGGGSAIMAADMAADCGIDPPPWLRRPSPTRPPAAP